jgi:hypothetical protein
MVCLSQSAAEIRMFVSEHASKRFNIPLHHQDLFLIEFYLQFFLQASEEPPSLADVRREYAKDDNLVAKNDRTHLPWPLVGLGEKGDSPKMFQESFAEPLDRRRVDWRAIVVCQRNEEVIFFHRRTLQTRPLPATIL